MNDLENIRLPLRLPQIMSETARLNFTMASDPLTGCLLRALSATKPAGDLQELGAGSCTWLTTICRSRTGPTATRCEPMN